MLNRFHRLPLRRKVSVWFVMCLVCLSVSWCASMWIWLAGDRAEYRENLEIGHGVTALLRERNIIDRNLAAARAKVEYDLHHDEFGGAR